MKNKLTPLRAIRKYCLWCGNGQANEVKLCTCGHCPLYLFRFGKKEIKGSLLKAIRELCKGCGEGTPFAIRNCEFTDCPLYPFRFGKNPAMKGRKGNPEVLKKWRENRRLKAE